MQYELFYLVGERQESELEAIKKEVNGILVSHKAILIEPELLEKRKLSYEIKHQKRGTYVTRRFELPEKDETENIKESHIEEITKKLNLFSSVLRFLIVKTDDLPELGSKEKRKAQEMAVQSQAPQRSQRPAEKQAASARPKKAEPIKPEQPKADKEPVKNIDEQLDKLLDI
jgi:ribosomal protein S6